MAIVEDDACRNCEDAVQKSAGQTVPTPDRSEETTLVTAAVVAKIPRQASIEDANGADSGNTDAGNSDSGNSDSGNSDSGNANIICADAGNANTICADAISSDTCHANTTAVMRWRGMKWWLGLEPVHRTWRVTVH